MRTWILWWKYIYLWSFCTWRDPKNYRYLFCGSIIAEYSFDFRKALQAEWHSVTPSQLFIRMWGKRCVLDMCIHLMLPDANYSRREYHPVLMRCPTKLLWLFIIRCFAGVQLVSPLVMSISFQVIYIEILLLKRELFLMLYIFYVFGILLWKIHMEKIKPKSISLELT